MRKKQGKSIILFDDLKFICNKLGSYRDYTKIGYSNTHVQCINSVSHLFTPKLNHLTEDTNFNDLFLLFFY